MADNKPLKAAPVLITNQVGILKINIHKKITNAFCDFILFETVLIKKKIRLKTWENSKEIQEQEDLIEETRHEIQAEDDLVHEIHPDQIQEIDISIERGISQCCSLSLDRDPAFFL